MQAVTLVFSSLQQPPFLCRHSFVSISTVEEMKTEISLEFHSNFSEFHETKQYVSLRFLRTIAQADARFSALLEAGTDSFQHGRPLQFPFIFHNHFCFFIMECNVSVLTQRATVNYYIKLFLLLLGISNQLQCLQVTNLFLIIILGERDVPTNLCTGRCWWRE